MKSSRKIRSLIEMAILTTGMTITIPIIATSCNDIVNQYKYSTDSGNTWIIVEHFTDRVLDLTCTSEDKITNIEFNKCTNLTDLILNGNNIHNLDCSNLSSLMYLSAISCSILEINITHNRFLNYLNIDDNPIAELNVLHNNGLWYLSCQNNNLSKIDLTKLVHIHYLSIAANHQLDLLNLINNLELEYVNCAVCNINSILFGTLSFLNMFNCAGNPLTVLDLSIVNGTNNFGWNTFGYLNCMDCLNLTKIYVNLPILGAFIASGSTTGVGCPLTDIYIHSSYNYSFYSQSIDLEDNLNITVHRGLTSNLTFTTSASNVSFTYLNDY